MKIENLMEMLAKAVAKELTTSSGSQMTAPVAKRTRPVGKARGVDRVRKITIEKRSSSESQKKPPPEGEKNWKKEFHTCPKCDHHGPVDPDFGVRVVRGIVRRQSWCAKCRASTNYYSSPRKYQHQHQRKP